jgi:HipA-like protein
MGRFRVTEKLSELLESWGLTDVFGGRPARRAQEALEVYRMDDDGDVLVGTLWQEEGQYRFAYDPSYRDRPDARPVIPAFPDLGHTYESPVLWPFFRVRLAPSDREDVQEAITEAGLDPEDPAHRLRLVELLGGQSPVSPFVFRLRAA